MSSMKIPHLIPPYLAITFNSPHRMLANLGVSNVAKPLIGFLVLLNMISFIRYKIVNDETVL